MAWNRDTNQGGKRPITRRAKGKSSTLVYIGVGVLLLVFVGLYLARDTEEQKPEVVSKPAQIAEVEQTFTNECVKVEKVEEEPKDEHLEYVNEQLRLAREKAKKAGLPWADKPRRVVQSSHKPVKRFEYKSEEYIAELLEAEPGTPFFGEFEYGEDFVNDLKNSLAFKLKDDPKDSEEFRELKKQVQMAKDQLYKSLLDGEDPAKIMNETRAELKQLGAVRMDMERLINDAFDNESDTMTAEDMEDFETAMNKLVKSKGLPPMQMPGYWKKKLALKYAERK